MSRYAINCIVSSFVGFGVGLFFSVNGGMPLGFIAAFVTTYLGIIWLNK